MEQELQFQHPLLFDGEPSAASVDEAYFTGICAGLSFRSLLAGGSYDPASEAGDPLEPMKTEPLFPDPTKDLPAVETPMYNFFSEATSSSLHHHLPGLRNYELAHQSNASDADSPVPNPSFKADPYGSQRPLRRRKEPFRLSDKTRGLRKLLPSDEKMDIATVLEEAYKYIKFLQAQVRALQSMPCQSGGGGRMTNIVGGDLGRLTRQQLLQVVTNSPAVQTQLCADSCCVFSAEQLVLMEKRAEREALVHEMFDFSNPNFFRA